MTKKLKNTKHKLLCEDCSLFVQSGKPCKGNFRASFPVYKQSEPCYQFERK